MGKIILSLLLFFTFTSCLQIEEKKNSGNANLAPLDYEHVPIRWSNHTVSTSNLNLLISNDFEANVVTDIKEVIDKWNSSHDDITFINNDSGRTPHINTANLDVYRDDVLGIYKSHSWFDELSTFALAVTQFFAARRNAGSSAEFLEILHADIIVNYRDYNYDPNTIAYSGYDLYSVVLHEAGHFLGLKHSNHVNDIMSPYLDTNEIKHSLSQNDVNIINDLYTATNPALMRKAVRDTPEEDKEDVEIIRGIVEIFPGGYHKRRYQVIK